MIAYLAIIGTTIDKRTVAKVTKNNVYIEHECGTIKEKRCIKDFYCWCDTFEDAQDWLIKEAKRHYSSALKESVYFKNKITKIKRLKD